MCFTDGQKLSTKQELLKTYQNKNWTKFWLTFFLNVRIKDERGQIDRTNMNLIR